MRCTCDNLSVFVFFCWTFCVCFKRFRLSGALMMKLTSSCVFKIKQTETPLVGFPTASLPLLSLSLSLSLGPKLVSGKSARTFFSLSLSLSLSLSRSLEEAGQPRPCQGEGVDFPQTFPPPSPLSRLGESLRAARGAFRPPPGCVLSLPEEQRGAIPASELVADMDWGTDLWDQYDHIDKHTLSGLDLVERYIKFVKERTEIEQNYAKQLRGLTKKYAKRGSKEEQDCKFSNHASLQEILNELNDYAGQRELIAENMMTGICVELTKYIQDLKQERKTYLSEAKKAQQNLESSFKQLESTKKRFAKEWAEAEKATQQAEKIESDLNATRIDVEKARQHAHARTHTAEECRSDYAAQLQKYNKEQNFFYYSEIPQIFNKMQALDENRIRRLAEGYCQFSDIEKKVLPIISKCLEGISAAGKKINGKQDSMLFIEQHKSGFERPGDVEFEDYTQGIKAATSDSSLNPPKVRAKLWPFSKKHKLTAAEDFSHLPPEQRKKRLQAKIDDITKELQKAHDQSDALEKMKGVYEHNPQMGDPSSLEPQITETAQNLGRLRGELAKYETWLSEAVGGEESSNTLNNNTQHGVVAADQSHNIYTEFEDEFEDIESPVGQCTALYTFEGNSEGTISITEGELLSIMEEDKGDGWMRVLRASGQEGYIPSSYVKLGP